MTLRWKHRISVPRDATLLWLRASVHLNWQLAHSTESVRRDIHTCKLLNGRSGLREHDSTSVCFHKVRVHRVLGSTGPRSSCHRTLPRRVQTGLSSNWPCTARNAGAEGACTTCYKPCYALITCRVFITTNSEHGPCSKPVNNTSLTTFVTHELITRPTLGRCATRAKG